MMSSAHLQDLRERVRPPPPLGPVCEGEAEHGQGLAEEDAPPVVAPVRPGEQLTPAAPAEDVAEAGRGRASSSSSLAAGGEQGQEKDHALQDVRHPVGNGKKKFYQMVAEEARGRPDLGYNFAPICTSSASE